LPTSTFHAAGCSTPYFAELHCAARRRRGAYSDDVALARAGCDRQVDAQRTVVARLRPYDERVVCPVGERYINHMHRRPHYGY
jgi:hypothetical protein